MKRLENDLALYENELLERKGRKIYLENLEKTKQENEQSSTAGGSTDVDVSKAIEPCPVCKGPFEKQASFLK